MMTDQHTNSTPVKMIAPSFHRKTTTHSVTVSCFVKFLVLAVPLWMLAGVVQANTAIYNNPSRTSPSRVDLNHTGNIHAGNAYLNSTPSEVDLSQAFPHRVVILAEMPGLQSHHISSDFGMRNALGGSKYHEGIDIPSTPGSAILSAGSGRVIYAGFSRGYGNLVVIDHGEGVTTRYAHAQQLYVRLGEYVAQSHLIATVGSTGNARTPHLHFEFRQYQQPIDPRILLGLNEAGNFSSSPAIHLVRAKNGSQTVRKLANNSTPNKKVGVLYSHDLKASLENGPKRKITPKPMYLTKNTPIEVRTDSNTSRQLTR